MAHLFDDYWEDIGSIKSFFEANIQLGSTGSKFDFFGDESHKFFTKQRFLAASRFIGSNVSESIISDGCCIGRDTRIVKSVIGIRSRIGEGVDIEQSVIMGADSPTRIGNTGEAAKVGIGNGVIIRRAILDKNTHVGEGSEIVNAKGVDHADTELYSIRDGIVVIPKNSVIPPGTII